MLIHSYSDSSFCEVLASEDQVLRCALGAMLNTMLGHPIDDARVERLAACRYVVLNLAHALLMLFKNGEVLPSVFQEMHCHAWWCIRQLVGEGLNASLIGLGERM